jgi:hypothetical protein
VRFGDKARDHFLEGLSDIFHLLGVQVAAGREHLVLMRRVTRQDFLFGKRAGKYESVWRGGYKVEMNTLERY